MSATYESDTYTDAFEHIADCPNANKELKAIVTIDDGTGKLYDYELTKELTWKEYYITPDFSYSPEEPTILEETDIVPNITDTFDVVKDDGVDYDFYDDGTQENKQEDETVTQVLSVPREQNVKMAVRYFTGWVTKTSRITKTIKKTNIPPKTCNTLDASCFTVPMEVYTSCSTDQEDKAEDLTIDWVLYLDKNSYVEVTEDDDGNEVRTVKYDEDDQDWEEQASANNKTVFSWTYNNEGRYKLVETATDTDGDSTTAERNFDIVFKKCSGEESPETNSVQAAGTIEIEANVWQLCAIPMSTGIWDIDNHKIIKSDTRSTIKNVVIDQIEDVYGQSSADLITVINAYIGDVNKYYNYIPGFTKETSEHNFKLVYTDDDMDVDDDIIKYEITGFWIKAKDKNLTINWGIIE